MYSTSNHLHLSAARQHYSATMMPKTAASTPALQLTTTALPLSFGFFVGVAPPAVPESVAADEPAGSVLDWLDWLVPSAEEPALDSVVVVAVPASVSVVDDDDESPPSDVLLNTGVVGSFVPLSVLVELVDVAVHTPPESVLCCVHTLCE